MKGAGKAAAIFIVATTSGCSPAFFGGKQDVSRLMNPPSLIAVDDNPSAQVEYLRGNFDGTAAAPAGAANPDAQLKAANFRDRFIESAQSRDNTKAALEMLMAGAVLSDTICYEWLQKVGEATAHANQDKDLFKNVGLLSSSLLNIFSASQDVAAATTAGFGFVGTSLDAAIANYIVAVDVPTAQRLVTENRRAFLRASIAQMTTPAASASDTASATTPTPPHYLALSNLIEYNQMCSRNGIKEQINRSVSTVADTLDKDKPATVDAKPSGEDKQEPGQDMGEAEGAEEQQQEMRAPTRPDTTFKVMRSTGPLIKQPSPLQ